MQPPPPQETAPPGSDPEPLAPDAADLFHALICAPDHAARAPLRQQLRELGSSALLTLSQELLNADAYVRWEAVNLLGDLAPVALLEEIVEFALHETDVHARLRGHWAVSQLPPSRTRPLLLQALSSRNWQPRWQAALMLSMMNGVEAAAVILEALGHASEETRLEALSAAKSLGHPSLAKAVARYLRADETPALRQEAALALGHIGGIEARRVLTVALDDPDPGVRWRAAMVYARFGESARSRLASRLIIEDDPMVRQTITDACARKN